MTLLHLGERPFRLRLMYRLDTIAWNNDFATGMAKKEGAHIEETFKGGKEEDNTVGKVI